MSITLAPADWLQLFLHFCTLSLLAVGGAITVAPDMHRFLVDQKAWISDPQFSASIAIAQAAPGPNVLFVGLMGWHVGLNAAGVPGALLGFALTLGAVAATAPERLGGVSIFGGCRHVAPPLPPHLRKLIRCAWCRRPSRRGRSPPCTTCTATTTT